VRIGSQLRHQVGVFQQGVGRFRKKPAQQHGLAGPPRAAQHHGRKVPGRLRHLLLQVPMVAPLVDSSPPPQPDEVVSDDVMSDDVIAARGDRMVECPT
jgi:hypothetical protein